MFNDRTVFVFYEHDSFIFCSVLYFLTLTLKDDTFESEHIRCLKDIYSFYIFKSKISLQLCWKESMKNVSIFQQTEQMLKEMCTLSIKVLSYDIFLQHFSQFKKSAEFCDSLILYCL